MADEIGQIQKSAALGASLERAHRLALEQGHGAVTLEHLLFAMTDDPEAATVLVASGLSMDRLRTEVSGYIARIAETLPRLGANGALPNQDFLRVLNLAATAARQSQRSSIDGAIVLAAIVGDGKTTAAALLKSQGLTFEEVIKVLSRHAAGRPAAPPPAPAQFPAAAPAAPGPAAVQSDAAGVPRRSPTAPAAPRPSSDDLLQSVRERVKLSEPPRIPLRGPAMHLPAPEAPPPAPPPPSAAPPPPPPAQGTPSFPPEPSAAAAQPPRSWPAPAAPPPPQPAAPPAEPPVAHFAAPPPPPQPPQQQPQPSIAGQPPRLPPRLPPQVGPPPVQAPPSRSEARPQPTPDPVPMSSAPQPRPAPQAPPPAPQSFGPPPQPAPGFGQAAPSRPGGQGGPGQSRVPSLDQRLAEYRPQEVRGGQPLPAHMLQAPAGPAPAPAGQSPPQSFHAPARATDSGFAPPRPDLTQAAVGIPEQMTVGRPSRVEVRLDPVDFLGGPTAVRGPAPASRSRPLRAVSLRLFDETGAFAIEPETDETRWLDAGQPSALTDPLVWSFLVTPRARGAHSLGVSLDTRAIGPLGFIGEPPIAPEMVEVRVRRDTRAGVHRFFVALVLAASGAAVWATTGQLIIAGVRTGLHLAGLR